MAQKKAAQKKETVNKIRAIADLIKAHSESDDELVTESNALEIQEFVAGVKEMMKSFDPSIFFTMNALSKINSAKTKQEATRRLESAMRMRDNYGDYKDTVVNILDIIGGVANKPELLDEILKDFLKSLSVIINKFGNVVEKSESVDVDIFEVIMRKIAKSDWLREETEEEAKVSAEVDKMMASWETADDESEAVKAMKERMALKEVKRETEANKKAARRNEESYKELYSQAQKDLAELKKDQESLYVSSKDMEVLAAVDKAFKSIEDLDFKAEPGAVLDGFDDVLSQLEGVSHHKVSRDMADDVRGLKQKFLQKMANKNTKDLEELKSKMNAKMKN